jgi:hypothetical protein
MLVVEPVRLAVDPTVAQGDLKGFCQ